jgi:hypothetical protein
MLYAPPTSSSRPDNSVYTWRRVQIMKLSVMQFSPPSRHSIPLRSKFSPRLTTTCGRTAIPIQRSGNYVYQLPQFEGMLHLLVWQGQAATANYRPILSSERAPHNNRPKLSIKDSKEKEIVMAGPGRWPDGKLPLGRHETSMDLDPRLLSIYCESRVVSGVGDGGWVYAPFTGCAAGPHVT